MLIDSPRGWRAGLIVRVHQAENGGHDEPVSPVRDVEFAAKPAQLPKHLPGVEHRHIVRRRGLEPRPRLVLLEERQPEVHGI